jgi:hypothetical protein
LLHAVLAAAVLLLDVPLVLTAVALAALATHALGRRPQTPKLLVMHADGTWDVPERGWHRLALAPGTTWTTWYVELVFAGPRGARVLVLKDQLDTEDWRALQLAVREHDSSATSVAGGP